MSPFETVIDNFHLRRLIVVGDVMLDRFVYGTVSRISPEAPAPVINVAPPEEAIGGAGNVARNIAALGARCDLIAVVGQDEAASCVRRHLDAYPGLDPELVEVKGRQTTLKTRFVAHLHNTHLLRADAEDTTPINADTEDEVIAAVERRLAGADAVIVSDYAKGMLTPRVIAAMILAAQRARKPVVVDPKGGDYSRYRGASVLTPNAGELAEFARFALGRPIKNEERALTAAALSLIEQIGCAGVLVTRGEHGMLMVDRDGSTVGFGAAARRVVDVSGAGDTVVASFALALVCDAGHVNATRLANSAAGIVVAKKGTSQVGADELRRVLLSRPHFELTEKITDLAEVGTSVEAWRRDGLTVGFTNGCFDLLHPGHVQLLCEARSHCDRLVVGLNSDASVKRIKGPGRPIQPEQARSIVIAGLAFVDAVILFDQDTPLDLIASIKPDVLIKGADYSIDQVVGRELVESYGGKVVLVDLVPDTSTTRIVDRLKRAAESTVGDLAAAK